MITAIYTSLDDALRIKRYDTKQHQNFARGPMQDTQQEISSLKEVEFYSASVNAWINTKFEHDKSLLTLSAGAIGLLITLISAIGVKSIELLIIYIIALLCFLICLVALLFTFKRNATHLEDVIQHNSSDDRLLTILDRVTVSSFLLGVLLSSIIGISTAIHSYTDKVSTMTDKPKALTRTIVHDSINGITSMRQNTVSSKPSENSASDMKVITTQTSTTQTKNNGESKQ